MDVDKEYGAINDEDDGAVQLVEETVEEMVTDDTNDIKDIEVEKHKEDIYPPLEDLKVLKRIKRRKEPTTE